MSTAGGALGGAIAVVIVRGFAPVNHRTYLDFLLLASAVFLAFDVLDTRKDTDTKMSDAAAVAGNAIGIAYVAGGTALTRQLGLA
jgi:hypothetical protein